MEASALRQGRMNEGLGAAFASAASIGCGVAAAIASAFKAPIARVFFALAVVVGHYGLGAFSPVVISSSWAP
jgi:H+/Cl- antiporter ClcA